MGKDCPDVVGRRIARNDQVLGGAVVRQHGPLQKKLLETFKRLVVPLLPSTTLPSAGAGTGSWQRWLGGLRISS